VEIEIFVLPTEFEQPPRAVLGVGGSMVGPLVVWSEGAWMMGGERLPDDLGFAISKHAASLGVEGFELG
jgi:hypothetical protein